MRIERLRVRDFRVHRDLDVELAPGLTVVRGPNEAGKTTLQRAIELALFRRVTTAGAEIESLRSWSSGPEARPWIAMDFAQDDDGTTRHGSLEKDFRGARGTVRLVMQDEAISDPARVDEALAELTGIPGEKFFRSTASIRHHEVNDLARDEGALRDRLQASISGADRGTSTARKKLERALHDLYAKGDKNPGRLRVAEAAVARAEATVAQGEQQLATLERDRNALVLAREERAQVEAALAERRSLLEKARQAERIASDRDAARERFERYRRAVELSDQVASLEAEHPSPNPLPILRQVVVRLRSLDREIAELQALLGADAVGVQYDVAMPVPRYRRFLILAGLLAFGGVGAIAAGILLAQVLVAVGGAIGVTIAFALGLYARNLRKAASDVRRQRELRDTEIARRLRGRSQIEEDLKRHLADRTQQLTTLGLPDLAAAEGLLTREDEHVQTIGRALAQLDGLVGKAPAETLPTLRDAAALDVEQKSGALDALGPIAREPRARERLEVEVRDQEKALERARDAEAGSRARVEQNPVDAEQVTGEAERLASWREQLAGLQRRSRVYQVAFDAIVRAERNTMRTATRYLESRMRADLTRLTGGRYRRVRVDDTTLDISIFAPERADWVPVEELSQGTVDLAYLAARIGLVRLVTQDRRPPLVMDDPFVTFDDVRAARAISLLRDLAADFQVIYLTTSGRYDSVADRVVELPGPSAVDAGADVAAERAAPAGARPA